MPEFDHEKETLYEAMGVSKERSREILRQTVEWVTEHDRISKALEEIQKHYNKEEERILAYYYVGYTTGLIRTIAEEYENIPGRDE